MFARTKRLVLRPGWAEDAQALADAIGHEDVLRNLLRAPMPYETRDAEEFLNRGSDARLPDFLAFARTGAAPRLVGGAASRAGTMANMSWATGSRVLSGGWALPPKRRRR